MMMLAILGDDYDDDGDVTEAGSDYTFETSSVMTCASSVRDDNVDMDWIPGTNIKQVCHF